MLLAYLPAFTQSTLVLDTKESKVHWKGKMWMSTDGHEGLISFSSGSITLDKDRNISQANFEIDMNTIRSLDAKPGKDGVADHLKNEDFFEVNKFPKATFSGTKISKNGASGQYRVEGFLTIKGIKKKIAFNVKLTEEKASTVVLAEAIIQRSWWGITYKSPNPLSLAKNELIADEIPVKLHLVFRKK